MNWILQGAWRKVIAICILLFAVTMILRDRQDNYDKVEQFQRRLLACTHHSESLSSQLEVINHYKETVDRMLGNEKNTSKKVAEAYESKIQYLNAKSDNLQMQLNECKGGVKGTDDIAKLQTENENYRKRVDELEEKVRQLNTQIGGHHEIDLKAASSNDSIKTNVTSSSKPIVKTLVNPEDHEDVNVQPVENPNFHAVPDTEIFFKKEPKQDLVFERNGAPPEIAKLLPQEEILKKISDRKAKKDKGEEDNVEDFREMPKPDADELDYKEIDH